MRFVALVAVLLIGSGCRPPTTVPEPALSPPPLTPVEDYEGPSVERMEGVARRFCLDWIGTSQCKVSCQEVDRWSASCVIRSHESYILTCTEDDEGGLWCEDEPIESTD